MPITNKEKLYKGGKWFTCCYPAIGARADHRRCSGEDENAYYEFVCICICHDGSRSEEDQRKIMLMRAESQSREDEERSQWQDNHRRVEEERAKTCPRCLQHYRWVGTATGYHCGCGANTKRWFNPWKGA